MRVSKENDSGDRRPWPTKRHTLGSYSARASANPRSHVGSGSAEPPFAASWPKRNPDSTGMTQPCRKETQEHVLVSLRSGGGKFADRGSLPYASKRHRGHGTHRSCSSARRGWKRCPRGHYGPVHLHRRKAENGFPAARVGARRQGFCVDWPGRRQVSKLEGAAAT